MKTKLKTWGLKAGIGAVIGAMALTAASPSMARDRYRGGGDDVAIAIGAGLVGLAIGAAIADRDDDRYYDRGYYESRRYVSVRGYPGYYYYYDGYPNRYYRDRYYDRYYAPYYRDRWSRGRDWRYSNRDYRRDYRNDYRRDYRDGRRDYRYEGRRDRHY